MTSCTRQPPTTAIYYILQNCSSERPHLNSFETNTYYDFIENEGAKNFRSELLR